MVPRVPRYHLVPVPGTYIHFLLLFAHFLLHMYRYRMFANEGAFDGTFCRFKNFFFFTRFFALFLIKILGIFLLCILLSPHELYVLFVFLNRTIVPKSYQNQSVLVYITTSIYIYIQCMYTYSVSLRVNN